jgi:hypothetical protein
MSKYLRIGNLREAIFNISSSGFVRGFSPVRTFMNKMFLDLTIHCILLDCRGH